MSNEHRIGRTAKDRDQPDMGGAGPHHLRKGKTLIEMVIAPAVGTPESPIAEQGEDTRCCSITLELHTHEGVDASPKLYLSRKQAQDAAVLLFELAKG